MANARQTFHGKLRALRSPKRSAGCDACAFVEHFRSNGDGQVARLHSFCRCPGGPYEDRPAPPGRWCERWKQADRLAIKPSVGDPNLTV